MSKTADFTTDFTADFTKAMTDMMGAFPMDATALADAVRNSAALSEKMSKVALDAVEKSTEISASWTKATISRLGDMTLVTDQPAEYSRSMTDFASASAEMAAENMAAFAEVAKKAQMDTVELLMSAGKQASQEASATVKKAAAGAAGAAKKTAAK